MVSFSAFHIMCAFSIYYVLGPTTLVFHGIYALMVNLMFESINYVYHYGLQRKTRDNGTYEAISMKLSFNSNAVMSSHAFFKLHRHADHHNNFVKPY